MKRFQITSIIILALVLLVQCSSAGASREGKQDTDSPKNIILFISDGMGYNHLKASNYFMHGEDNAQRFQTSDWLHLSMTTYPAVVDMDEEGIVYASGYNPKLASTDPEYVKKDVTDSGAAGTALSTGKKVYRGSIGMNMNGDTLVNISQIAKQAGKSTGVVSSVQLSHATPASFLAKNKSRNNYAEIARYMFFNTQADVIMGGGNPDFNADGKPEQVGFDYVGGEEIWNMLKENDQRMVFETSEGTFKVKDIDGDERPDPWTLIQSREEFQRLAEGNNLPKRVLGVPRIHKTLQQDRTAAADEVMPYDTPLNENVPTLQEMTRAAINVLSQNRNGFFVMVEGGAVDWASHGNNSVRVLEEQIDFNNSVHAAIEWVEQNSSWEETLIIVTADHECGYLTGPGDANPLYPSVTNNGANNLPGMNWHHGGHTNVLVPFYARGAGSENFTFMAGETDPVYGDFIDNTDIAKMVFFTWGKPGEL